MTRSLHRIIAVVSVIALAGCAAGARDVEAGRAALMQTSRDWAKAAASGDLERALSRTGRTMPS
jgi:hypothetical protein